MGGLDGCTRHAPRCRLVENVVELMELTPERVSDRRLGLVGHHLPALAFVILDAGLLRRNHGTLHRQHVLQVGWQGP